MRAIGVFNPLAGTDSKLFVDSKLLEQMGGEFKGSTTILQKYFNDTITLLKLSRKKHDSPWDRAWKRMQFKETSNTALGFSKEGTNGNGIGPVLAEKIIIRAQEILPHVDFDPDIFELFGVFADNLGCDRLSDMLVSILIEKFLAYTNRITRQLNVQRTTLLYYRGKQYCCPQFAKKDKPYILIPKKILRPLPIAQDLEEALHMANLNEEVRQELNILFSAAYKAGRRPGKADLLAFVRSHPKIYRQILVGYKSATSEPYDFDRDIEAVSDFKAIAGEIAGDAAAPLQTGLSEQQRVDQCVKDTIAHLRQHFEHNRLSDCIFDDNGEPRNELIAQRIFYSVSAIFAERFNVSISREPNAGSGAVDFHFSVGFKYRKLLELKLSSHPRLVDAYLQQLPAYSEGEQVRDLVLLVIRVDDGKELEKLFEMMRSKPDSRIRVELIDAIRKPSASKRRGRP
jgi:hypothetical protein